MLTDTEKLARYEAVLAWAKANVYALKGMPELVERLTGEAVPELVSQYSKEDLERFRQADSFSPSEFGGAG